jgi:arylsulfatase A-like enzyme
MSGAQGAAGWRFARAWVLTVAALGGFGAALALWALTRDQLPALGAGERVRLVLRWTAVAAVAGAGPGIVSGLVAARVRRRGWHWLPPGLVALAVAALVVGRVGTAVPRRWSGLGTPVAYPAVLSGPAAPDAPNVVLLTIDTLRRDHLPVYGYPRQTAPALAAFARGGTVFDHAIAQAPETLRSMASLVTGLYPWVVDHDHEARGGRGPFVGSAFHTLAERLAAVGYDTAAFVSNAYLKRRNGFDQGFHHYDDRSAVWGEGPAGRGRHAEDVVAPAIAWLDGAVPPFFLWVHVMDPHHPYEPVATGPWEGGAAQRHRTLYDALSVAAYTRRLKDLRGARRVPEPGEIEYLVGRYDAEILETDRALARLLGALSARGFDDRNTVAIVTADHGEEFMDHGGMLHGHTLFDELLLVPLIVRGPRALPGRRVATQVELVDVAATVLDLAAGRAAPGGERPLRSPGALDGRSLVPALAGGSIRPRPALAVRDTHYVALRTPRWKLVAAFEPYDTAPPPWAPWSGLAAMVGTALGRPHRPKIGLWRLEEDPGERRDRLRAEPATGRRVLRALSEGRRAHPPRAVVSPVSPGPARETVEALRALGYTR